MRRLLIANVFLVLTAACSPDDPTAPAWPVSPASNESQSPDSWRVIADAPLPRGYGYRGVWTGEEMLVWGGSALDPETLMPRLVSRGAAYDPKADTWRRIPAAPIKSGTGYSVTWTGDEVLVWGDPDRGSKTKSNRGAAFDPKTSEWRRIPSGPLTGRSGHLAVWTGDELIVWGGWLTSYERERYDGSGAAYDPETDSWRKLPRGPLPAGYDAKGAWTGGEVLVMSTPMGIAPEDYPKFDELAAFDPETNSWRELERPPQVSYVSPPVAYVDGKLAVLSLGGTVDGGEVNAYDKDYETGGVYDYSTDKWTAHAQPPKRPQQTWEQTAMGSEIVIDALAYNPSTDSWRTLPEFPLREREFPVVVWTGDELIVWGGAKEALGNRIVDPPPPLNDGAAYAPPQ